MTIRRILPAVLLAAVLAGCAGSPTATSGEPTSAGSSPAGPATSTTASSAAGPKNTTESTVSTLSASASGPVQEPATPPPADTPESQDPGGPTGTVPYSNTELPTLQRPTAPPSAPSDLLTGLWVLGSITEAGDGCYVFTATDGQEFSVSGAALGAPAVGDRLRLRLLFKENGPQCGTGDPMTVLEVKHAG